MAIKTSHIALTLRGDNVSESIRVESGLVPFQPSLGNDPT